MGALVGALVGVLKSTGAGATTSLFRAVSITRGLMTVSMSNKSSDSKSEMRGTNRASASTSNNDCEAYPAGQTHGAAVGLAVGLTVGATGGRGAAVGAAVGLVVGLDVGLDVG